MNHYKYFRFSLEKNQDCDSLLIVQCDCGDQNSDLIACARHSIQRELQQITEKHEGNVHVVLIVQLPRVAGDSYTGFQVSPVQINHKKHKRSRCHPDCPTFSNYNKKKKN